MKLQNVSEISWASLASALGEPENIDYGPRVKNNFFANTFKKKVDLKILNEDSSFIRHF
jgi:hypothetical protein